MAVRTQVGNGALYATAHPEKTDIIVEEMEDDVWLVLGRYVICENALGLYIDDLAASLLDWSTDEEL